MDNADYLDVALRLANADFSEVETVRAALHEEPWWADRLTERDVRALRPVGAGIADVLDAAMKSDARAAKGAVNSLLAKHPLRPTLSAGHAHEHDGAEPNWHIHVADTDAPPATEVAAAAAWGMAHGIVHYGLDRWGRCAATECENYYLDTSTTRTKRFCSPRCANRMHVAAHRARHRD
ncbi:CGNR zinc finger protein [Herbihabitans rhizosphaerae]|uniref:CGNR zinc finger protein n=1 Tax=Herbihabitans rhizosphaerae TaxID=1872711 RepID=A0A4Q7KCS6_9PSEU|nr:CGNR zinc finger domain-containing protein [Herbihabitans rhizosphaerae]RZS30523.1 CGNR zinc finger protein [Herbihabitans rhizosphaerae]